MHIYNNLKGIHTTRYFFTHSRLIFSLSKKQERAISGYVISHDNFLDVLKLEVIIIKILPF